MLLKVRVMRKIVKVKFKQPFPIFVYLIKGKMVKVGPFDEGDEIFLPERVAEILTKKNKAVILSK